MKIYLKNSIFIPDSLTADKVYLTYPPIIVSCAVCGEDVGFTLKDFYKYSLNKKSNLKNEDDLKITKFVEDHKEELSRYPVNGIIDYYCPVCKTPIRIYFQGWGGGKFTGGYVIHFIIE